MIRAKELAGLPFATLAAMATALARDIDAGEDKRECLEAVFAAIYSAK